MPFVGDGVVNAGERIARMLLQRLAQLCQRTLAGQRAGPRGGAAPQAPEAQQFFNDDTPADNGRQRQQDQDGFDDDVGLLVQLPRSQVGRLYDSKN
jgi:hypothetical protein